MGYQEYVVYAPSVKKLYDLLVKPGVLTGLSEPLCFSKARKTIEAVLDGEFPGLEKGQEVLVMGGERHGMLVDLDRLEGEEKEYVRSALWVPIEELAEEKDQEYEEMFEDTPILSFTIDPELIQKGYVNKYGVITGREDQTLLLVNEKYLVSIGDIEGYPIDEEILFAFHIGDSLTELNDGVLPDGETLENIKLAVL